MKKSILALVAVLCIENAFAQSQPLTTQSISIFKNGQAFYIKNGTLKPTNGKFLLPDPAPQALYGTLWFNSPDGSLSRVASYPDTLREQKTEAAVVVWDLLRNNVGKLATGFVDDKNTVSGKIISVSPAFKDEKGEPIYGPTSLVTLQSQQGGVWTTIPAGQIRYVSFLEQPNLDVSMSKVTPRHLIELSFNNKKGEQPFDMMYLANGLNWAPEYLLELAGENEGILTMQGEIANDVEDILTTNLNLVVGVPNFLFAKEPAYLIDFLNLTAPTNYSGTYQNTLSNAQYAIRYDTETYEEQAYVVEGTEGTRNEDLFFYTLKNFSLPKGGRSIQPIFKEKVKVKHVYECLLPSNESSQIFEQDFLFAPQSNKVVHTLKLDNTTNQPWTTAPIFVMNAIADKNEKKPLSQDRLIYTPIGEETYVKLTDAVEVKVVHAEREIDRQRNAITDKRFGSLDLVQVEGKIKIKSFKDKQLDVRIQRTIMGTLKKSNVDWKMEETVNYGNWSNRKTNAIWETPIKANSELEIVYTYEIYVPSY